MKSSKKILGRLSVSFIKGRGDLGLIIRTNSEETECVNYVLPVVTSKLPVN